MMYIDEVTPSPPLVIFSEISFGMLSGQQGMQYIRAAVRGIQNTTLIVRKAKSFCIPYSVLLRVRRWPLLILLLLKRAFPSTDSSTEMHNIA